MEWNATPLQTVGVEIVWKWRISDGSINIWYWLKIHSKMLVNSNWTNVQFQAYCVCWDVCVSLFSFINEVWSTIAWKFSAKLWFHCWLHPINKWWTPFGRCSCICGHLSNNKNTTFTMSNSFLVIQSVSVIWNVLRLLMEASHRASLLFNDVYPALIIEWKLSLAKTFWWTENEQYSFDR